MIEIGLISQYLLGLLAFSFFQNSGQENFLVRRFILIQAINFFIISFEVHLIVLSKIALPLATS